MLLIRNKLNGTTLLFSDEFELVEMPASVILELDNYSFLNLTKFDAEKIGTADKTAGIDIS